MPTTYNGIGTHYYGHRNSTTHYGFCNQCKRELMLTDYETTLWFCVLYIPVIPLGKQQIVNQCPGCTYHYAVPLKNWQKQGDEAVDKVSETLAQNTSDPEKVMEMHATLSGFHRHEEALALAQVMLAKFGQNSEVLFYLASWHEHFARFKESDDLFVKASDAAPQDMEKLAASAFALARQNDLDNALKRMNLLEPPAIPQRASLVRHVARQLAVNFRQAEAYALLLKLLEAVPQLKYAKDFQAEIRPLEKGLGVKQSIVPAFSFWQKPMAKWIGLSTAALLALVALAGWNFYVMQNAPVYAVNGVSTPIEFSIDGGPPQLIRPQGHVKLTLPEGKHQVNLLKPKLPGADPFEIDIHQAWYRRFLSKPAFVIDPSRTAVVVYSKIPYMAQRQLGVLPEYSYHPGSTLTQYPHVDHRFERLPETVDMGSSRVVYRTGIRLFEADPFVIKSQGDLTLLSAVMQRRLLVTPHDTLALESLALMMMDEGQDAEFLEFLSQQLSVNPPLISWHRLYQNLIVNKRALAVEYDQYLESYPKDAAYIYLRGRICEGGSEANQYFDRAIAADPNSYFAYLAKGKELRSRAKYVEADEILKTAWDRLQSDSENSTSTGDAAYLRQQIGRERLETLIAAGRYDEFDNFEVVTRGLISDGEETPLTYLSALRKGNPDAIKQFRGRNSTRITRLAVESPILLAQTQFAHAMYEGDLVAMRQAASRMPEPPRQQLLDAIAFDEGTDPVCKTVLGATNEMAYVLQKLLTSLRNRELGRNFETPRAEAIANMKFRGGAASTLAGLFEKSPSVTIEEVDDISLQARERGIVLIALAYENPPQKIAMLRHAWRLLLIPGLPQKCLEDWIERGQGE